MSMLLLMPLFAVGVVLMVYLAHNGTVLDFVLALICSAAIGGYVVGWPPAEVLLDIRM